MSKKNPTLYKNVQLNFYRKMIYNILSVLTDETYEYGLFLDAIRSHTPTVLTFEANEYINKQISKYSKKHKTKSYISTHKCLKKKHRSKILSIMSSKHPEVLSPFVIPDNIKYFSKLLDFDTNEMNLLYFYSFLNNIDHYQGRVFETLRFTFRDAVSFCCACFDVYKSEMTKIFSANTNLLTSGILENINQIHYKGHYQIVNKISELLDTHDLTDKKLIKNLINEAGGHRLQRVPPNEKRGRVHTSTVTVSVLETDIKTDDKYKKWSDDDFIIEWIYGNIKAGGQHKNKHACSCRVIHIPTGFIEIRQGRKRVTNLRDAKHALLARLKTAIKDEIHETMAVDRKNQVGSGMRGDKTATIRFQNDQVQHHISGKSMSVKKYMKGYMDEVWD